MFALGDAAQSSRGRDVPLFDRDFDPGTSGPNVHPEEVPVRRMAVRGMTALALLLLFLPGTASAQSAIAGVARDTTGAVMPGVTVEATSPALIERSGR
jgi:hypothetical protein